MAGRRTALSVCSERTTLDSADPPELRLLLSPGLSERLVRSEHGRVVVVRSISVRRDQRHARIRCESRRLMSQSLRSVPIRDGMARLGRA
jgi:hypothetical protein